MRDGNLGGKVAKFDLTARGQTTRCLFLNFESHFEIDLVCLFATVAVDRNFVFEKLC